MFMPGYVPVEDTEDWKKQQKLIASAMAKRKVPTLAERKARKQVVKDRAARSERARLAGERGASAAEILEIMCGRA